MKRMECRSCGEEGTIARVVRTVRMVTAVRIEGGTIVPDLGAPVEIDDASDSFAWQCQSCGTEGDRLEDVLIVPRSNR